MNPRTNIHPEATSISYKDSFNVINSYNNTHEDERSHVLDWLSPLEPRKRHQDVRTSRLDGVGEWLLRRDEFTNWHYGKGGSDRTVLFCSGAPGVGKTYLSSLVIDALCDQNLGQKVAVACFYYDFQDQKTQTPENILGALVKQLIRGLEAIPYEIDEAFQKSKSQVGGRGLRVDELLPLLQAALAPLERAFICVDALDECLGKHLPELLRSLCTISQWSPKIRLFITGRPHIQREIEKYFPGGAHFIEIKPTMEDIMKYLQRMLDNDPEPEAMNPDLKAEIVKQVSETISDAFLLVSLNIAAILAEATTHGRREQLERMTNGLGLGTAYRVALDRMEAQGGAKSRLGMATLMWISRSERPMTVDELCYALGVEIGPTDLNPENIPSIQTLLASCLGLVTVDETGSTVRLVHFTFQEYLDSHPEIFWNPYATMAKVCLTYLNYDSVNKLPPTLHPAPPATPFLEYASTYWGPYARNETTEEVKLLTFPLLFNFESHISAKLLLRPHISRLIYEPASQPEEFTGLHCVAFLGIDEIASALLQIKNWDINRTDFLGRTPLMWAAENGCEDIIKLFLKRKGINFRTGDNTSGRTALSLAAGGGHEGIVKLLLDQEEVDVESGDNHGRTPLSHAARSGNEGVVKLFLEREEVNAKSRDNEGRTPLSYAAESGSERAVKLFLDREGVNAESKDNGGRAPLFYAVECRSEGVVKLFLEREEVNAESKDREGRTLLSYAAEFGNEGVVELFLGREEVNTESRDNRGRTPLSRATESGNEGAVKLLLEREEVNAESRSNGGRTPLSYAAESGNEGVVKLFLGREEVNAESQDNGGRTPLSYATGSWNKRVVELFPGREEVNVESRDNRGRTPLSHATEFGNKGVVKLLLEREEVNAELKDNYGRTPLSYAAQSGNKVVKLLLGREEVNAESRDNDGRTPLSWVAGFGNEAAVKLFLEREEVNPDLRDYNSRTPLSWAAWLRNEGVVKLLLEREEVSAESRDNVGRAPLSYAAESGNEAAVKSLLEREEVNPDLRDYDGRTPLSYAAQHGNEGVVKLFLEQEEVSAEFKDNGGKTSLSRAPQSENEGVVKLFLEREEVNAESRDNEGRTPLSWAAQSGNEGVVKLILEREEVNAESQDNDGRTPLSYAVEGWNEGAVKLFLEREEVNAESRDNNGRTPLSHAAGRGWVRAVNMLLQCEEVDAESQDNYGRTPLFYSLINGSTGIGKILLEPRAVNPRSSTLFDDREVAQRLRECLDIVPAIQPHDARTPNSHTDNHNQGSEPLVQPPPHPQHTNVNTPQECTQLPSPATPSVGDSYQNPEIPAQGSKLNSLTSPPAYPVLPAIAPLGSLHSLSQPILRRFSQAFGDDPSSHISTKRNKSS